MTVTHVYTDIGVLEVKNVGADQLAAISHYTDVRPSKNDCALRTGYELEVHSSPLLLRSIFLVDQSDPRAWL